MFFRYLSRAVVLVVFALGMSSFQPAAFGQKPPSEVSDDPEDFRKLTQLPEGFEIQLVASEPTIVNPIQINFDPHGRLWVLCAPRYPQILPGQEPKDYVVVLEDFDANGKAKKSTVFVEGLTVPTGMMPGDGGVYVGQGETLLHFSDPKKMGKATERKVVFAGFGTSDTHHTLNTFRWGPPTVPCTSIRGCTSSAPLRRLMARASCLEVASGSFEPIGSSSRCLIAPSCRTIRGGTRLTHRGSRSLPVRGREH